MNICVAVSKGKAISSQLLKELGTLDQWELQDLRVLKLRRVNPCLAVVLQKVQTAVGGGQDEQSKGPTHKKFVSAQLNEGFGLLQGKAEARLVPKHRIAT